MTDRPGGAGKPDREYEQLKEMRRNLDKFKELQAITAEVDRAYYVALTEQGFSAEQALEILKATKRKPSND